MKPTKIFIGVTPDSLHENGAYNMLVADSVAQTVTTYPLNIGQNALLLTINESTVIAFQASDEPLAQLAIPDNVIQLAQKEVENNLQLNENSA